MAGPLLNSQGIQQRPERGITQPIPKTLILGATILLSALFTGCTGEGGDVPPAPARTAAPPAVLPDMSAVTDVQAKKKLFFDFLRPIIKAENDLIIAKRRRLEQYFQVFQHKGQLGTDERRWLEELALAYRVPEADFTQEDAYLQLLRRVDIVPADLALVQAANESAWGTARFARQGNNLFGQWCFTKDCGLVPLRRDSGASHEVAVFASVEESVNSYLHNLNTGSAYKALRSIRHAQRSAGKTPEAQALAAGLEKYSSRGTDYIAELRTMLRVNAPFLHNAGPDTASIKTL